MLARDSQPGDQPPPPFDGVRVAGGAPLFASRPGMGARTRATALAIPPLPGTADLVICMTSDRVWGLVGAREMASEQ